MPFDFSLTQDPFTPIRPQKVEQLFSPSGVNRMPARVLNDITYHVPIIKPNITVNKPKQLELPDNLDEFNLPDRIDRFPRQSTGIKSNKQSLPPIAANETVATNLMLSSDTEKSILLQTDENLTNHCTVPQYRPYYMVQDPQPTRATCFHPLGDVFVVGSNSKTLRVCMYPSEDDLKEFKTTTNSDSLPLEPELAFTFLKIHRGSIYCAGFNITGDLLATGSNDQTVHLIQWNSKKNLPEGNEHKFTMHSGTVRDLCFLHNNGENDLAQLITAGAGGNEIFMTDCKAMKGMQTYRGHESTVMSLNCWGDPNSFVSGSLDKTIRFWDTRSGRCTRSIRSSGANFNMLAPVGSVRVEPSGKLLISGHEDGTCMLYDINGGRVLQSFKAHDDEIRSLDFSPKSYYLLTASYDHKIKLMDLQGDLTRKLPSIDVAELDDKIIQAAWHPTEYTFVTTSADGSATLWALPEDTNNAGSRY